MAGDKETESNATSDAVADHTSPYYLHPSDYPRQLHVNETLNDSNYLDWVSEMETFLFAKNKIGFVDGTLRKPEKTHPKHMPWLRCDAMIRGWLTTAMEKEIRVSVKYANSAEEIWKDLQERFGKENAPRAYELKQLLMMTKQDSSSVSAYYTKLRTIWDEISAVFSIPRCSCAGCTCGASKKITDSKDKERLYEFLLGFDNEYSTIRTQILAMKPIPSLGEAYHLVSEDEQQKVVSMGKKTNTDTAAFQAFMKKNGAAGNRNTAKSNKKAADEKIEHCVLCDKDGHSRDGCFRVIGYPDWWPGKGKTEKGKAKAACVDTKQDTNELRQSGTSPIPGLNEEQYRQFLHMFTTKNMANVEITQPMANMAGIFDEGNGWIDLSSRKLIGTGRCENGLYRMRIGGERMAMAVGSNLWHKRLGHASHSKLSCFDFISLKTNDETCDSCARAKFTRLPFITSFIKSKECFELLHCDIWGRYRTPSLTGANYFLTIVDDFSRSVWVYLLKRKSDASNCLISFQKMVKTQFNKNVKRIRCDNGGEFTSNRMVTFYNEEGMLLETTCPHTPQQNGVVERKHRHLLETARALKFEAKLPSTFWGECILTAAYIINKLPSTTINNKTPYEIIYNQKPNYDHMRVFGCLSYYRSTETRGDKFEERGRPGIFLGYPYGTKGYKVFDIKNKKMVVSRDVKFVEDVFPYDKINKCIEKEEGVEMFELPSWCFHDQNDMATNEVEETNTVANNSPHEVNMHMQNHFNNEPSHENVPVESNRQPDDLGPIHEEGVERSNVQAQETMQPPPRERRSRTRPARLNDYVVHLPPSIDQSQPDSDQGSSTVHPIANFISYDKFTNSHKAFLSAISSNDEPKSFKQAVQNPNWKEAMKREIRALEQNGTWTLEDLPEGKHAIGSKWVYKLKYKPDGQIERYKARLVAKGFTQMEGIDFHDTFAPVAKLVTVRTLLAVATKRNWVINQLDVNNAFLHGELDEEIYMKIPQGFEKGNENKVCRLRRSLYGLKQASRNWYQKFTTSLQQIGFEQSRADHSLLIFKSKESFVAALIYVDDVILTGNDVKKIEETKAFLDNKFSIKDLGPLKYFLGIEVTRTREGLILSQRKYILDILEDSGMMGCKPSAFPMEQNTKLAKNDEEVRADANQYRRLVGRLLYLQATRPDITYSVNVLSQFVGDPRANHMEAAMRVLRYLKGTPGQGILLSKGGGTNLVGYTDSDWLGCPDTRRSRSGYLLLLGGSPVSWKSKKQTVVSRSSAEAEYRAMASTVSEILWLRWLLKELNVEQNNATQLFCDNLAVKHIANNPVFHERTKHVEMDCYFVRERVESNEVEPLHIDTKSQIADLFTKPLGSRQLGLLLGKLGICDPHAPT
ncbi:putative RNA-directed DNA polymerase [Helianthus annuus]|nr:putative RNA-directed DNA polymerase [Helianthus annuus]KAJ0583064.1 putative RNA-directed DNA polymerase [Helianthus annuus]